MVITNEVDIPGFHELDVAEVNVTTAGLMTAAPHLGKLCENVNNEFMLCRQETMDPRACLELGKRVTECALNVFREIKCACADEYNQYLNCIDKSSGDYSFQYCRNTQKVFDDCMREKLCSRRPPFGYFCRGRIHNSASDEPDAPPCPCKTVDDPTPKLPDKRPRQPARFGSRFWWITE